MGLIASALSGVGSGHEVDRPEVAFPVGFGPENFLVTSVRASPSFIALPGRSPLEADVVRLGRWAVSVSTYQRTATASLYFPLVAFGFGPSRAAAELPEPLPFDGVVTVHLLGRPIPPGPFEFTIHIGGVAANTPAEP
jgi:hypothetical protein